MTTIELQAWIDQSIRSLSNSETPFLEIQVITAFILGQSREWVIAHPDYSLTSNQITRLETALARLKINEPLAYITSQRAFYGMDFKVTPAVLIPRPETELLIEEAIQWLENNPHRRSAVDVGTGSGIIAITLADTFLDLILTAIDISEEAIQVAQENAHVHQMDDRIRWQKNDLLTQIEGKFDIILANLPYIPTQILNSLDVGKFEPRLALDGGPDGLQLLRRLLRQAPDHLRVGGAIFLEIESTLGEPAIQLASECFPQANIDLLKDYAELPRLIKIQT